MSDVILPQLFPSEFLDYMDENAHVYEAFEQEAIKAARVRQHYSARTIVEVLRHNSTVSEKGGEWKLNDHHTPYLARLFAINNPTHARLFEFRRVAA